MKLEHLRIGTIRRAIVLLCLVLGWGLALQAQTVRILYRPLSPQEIKNFGLTNTTQKSGGAPNAGIGQPVYVEALITTGTVVNSVTFSVIATPPGSTYATNAVLPQGPLSNAVPTYDGGDRIGLFVAGRSLIKPDIQSYFDFNPAVSNIVDYKIRTDIVLTNKTLSYTNAVFGSVFVGQKSTLCILCHADKQANFDLTDHANAFKNQITGVGSDHFSSNCISCHTLGYDTTVEANNNGFDDVALQIGWTFPSSLNETNWTGMNSNLQHRSNVQCENCHGPASTHMTSLGRTNAIDVSLSAGTCGQCHDSLSHHVKNYEWGQTLHSTGYVFRFSGACMPCHSSKGFIETWDPYYLATNKVPRSTEQEGIACAACHDPHGPGMGDKQLRAITTASLSNGVVITYAQAGTGVLCMNCHHARQKATTYVTNTPSSNFGPHYGVQGDMLAGENAYEYGMTMPSSRHMLAVTNSCVGCHMQLIAGTSFSNANTRVGGHTFRISWDAGTTNTTADDVHVTEVCAKCHVENTFDIVAEDYDRDGTPEGVQTEIEGLLEELGMLLPPIGSPVVTVSSGYTLQQRKAAYNYLFVEEDQSHGVHNPKYAAAILQASIDDMRGGIDVDRDGLADAWEITNFGSITAYDASDDPDNDSLTNEQEKGLGTNPNLADSDNDLVNDMAEFDAGSNPLDFNSVPETNQISAIPALELAYVPSQAGITQIFQSVDMMETQDGWTNIGPAFVSSNGLSYQLLSLRHASNQFFRVIKP